MHQSESLVKMSSNPLIVVTIAFLSFILLHSSAQASGPQATALYSTVKKDDSTNLYTMLVYLKTPLQPSQLHLDLGSYLPWCDCFRHYKSSSYLPVLYNASLCLDIDSKVYGNCFDKRGPGCANDTCTFFPENPVNGKGGLGQLLTDKFALLSARNPTLLGPVSEIVLSCTNPNKYAKSYRGLARGSKGLAALGQFNYSLPAQIARASSSPQTIFALCLPSSSNASGMVLFNSNGPYNFSPSEIDAAKLLTYTSLVTGPVTGDSETMYWYKSPHYYIRLTSMRVNGKPVPLNQTLMTIDERGRGGTRFNTSTPYTVLQTSIFKALTNAFAKESNAFNLTIVKPVEPFSLCYAANNMPFNRVGPVVPVIDLVLETNDVVWRIYGSNSMVRIKNNRTDNYVDDAWCLGFVDGGSQPRASIMIGGHQIEDNLLQFDLERQRLGFSSSLLSRSSTKCADFKL